MNVQKHAYVLDKQEPLATEVISPEIKTTRTTLSFCAEGEGRGGVECWA